MSALAESLLISLLDEQRQTNQLLTQLIQTQAALVDAMADESECADEDEPTTYMDGTPCR